MDSDDGGWDGPNIRPPQHKSGQGNLERNRRPHRPSSYAARKSSGRGDSRRDSQRPRNRHDQFKNPHSNSRQHSRDRKRGEDLRDRIGGRQGGQEDRRSGFGRSGNSRNVTVMPPGKRNDNRRRTDQKTGHDLAEKRRLMEKETKEMERKLKRKRERENKMAAESSKKRKDETESEDDDDEGEEDTESGSASGSEEASSESDSGSGSNDTASERSGATPDNVSEDGEVEDEPEEVPEKKQDEVRGRWGDDDNSSEGSRSRSRSKTKSRSPRRTPSVSPTPMKEETPTGQNFADDIQELEAEAKEEAAAAKVEEEEDVKDFRDDLPPYLPSVHGCRSVEEFHCLNRIEEGTYGVVYRARDKRTNEIVALKRLKMEREKEGFPITSLREINTLLISQHRNVVTCREIVVGSNMDKIYIVMDFVEHDLKSLMETMRKKSQVFLPGEIKCLMTQLLSAINHLHDNWILHRDLKSSNLLLSHNGILKVGDFGLAREYGSPLQAYTAIVVTLWYRAPELLLGTKGYSTPIDVWSIGCIFGELLLMNPLFPGESEVDELNKIFKLLGTPSEKIWPGYSSLPAPQKMKFADFPVSNLRQKFSSRMLSDKGLELLKMLLTYDPKKRISCDQALGHDYFREAPVAIDPKMFPTWPAKSEGGSSQVKKAASPKPPSGGGAFKKINDEDDDSRVAGFELKFGAMPPSKVWNLKF